MRKHDEAFEAFRAGNPVEESTVPGPDSAQAQAVFADITSTPRHQARRARYSRRRLAIAVAVALLALASIAAAWLIFRDVSDPVSVVCYEAPSLDSDAADTATGGDLDVALCNPVWEDAILVNEDITPIGQVPPLVGCVTDTGNLAVFPSDNQALCAQLGLANPEPDSESEGDVLRQLDADLVEHFDQQECQPIDEAEEDVRRILDSYGLDDWQIQVSPGGPGDRCASYGLDTTNLTVRLIPIPRLG